MGKECFLGFGFGPIQGGLFLSEAYRSGYFDRLVVAEVNPELVDILRSNSGCYCVNVATRSGIEVHQIEGVEVFNPLHEKDRDSLVETVAQASEIATALPSVELYEEGENSVAGILAEGFLCKLRDHSLPCCVIYAAENHNCAAEILIDAISKKLNKVHIGKLELDKLVQGLNTVIGKMSGVVVGRDAIALRGLKPIVEGTEEAFLVESFNRILISQISISGFTRGISTFEEKRDLLPFEEAKLYGHNATHALIGYLAHRQGYEFMSEVRENKSLMALAQDAFLKESGRILIARHAGVDDLFTPKGYRHYALDLLERMVNPFLRDSVKRVVRDPRRKLGWNDRFFGTIRLALSAGLTPWRYAAGAALALNMLQRETGKSREALLDEIWPIPETTSGQKKDVSHLLESAERKLDDIL